MYARQLFNLIDFFDFCLFDFLFVCGGWVGVGVGLPAIVVFYCSCVKVHVF